MLRFLLCLLLIFPAAPLWAEPLMGLWLTPEDHKGQVAHVRVRACGAGYCGRIVAVRKVGQTIEHHNIGKDLFTDMQPQGGGAYAGTGWVPVHNVKIKGKAQVRGDTLVFSGCALGMCRRQIWQRLK